MKSELEKNKTEQSVSLDGISQTLCIPLVARALGDSMFPNVAVGDRYAARFLEMMGDDGHLWLHDRVSIYCCLMRCRQMRTLAQAFLTQHPDAVVINLGCGLSYYYQWLENGEMQMYDCDLPQVLDIRRRLINTEDPLYHQLSLDLTDPHWWENLALPPAVARRPVFLFSEGVLIYFSPDTVRSIFRTFAANAAPGSRFVFDATYGWMAGQAFWNPSVYRAGAQIRWGPYSLSEFNLLHHRLRLLGTHEVMDMECMPFPLWPLWQWMAGVPVYATYELTTTN